MPAHARSARACAVIVAMVLSTTLGGCSVGMALSGGRKVDLAALQLGQPRADVLKNLGKPTRTTQDAKGMTDHFRVQTMNEPSVARAFLNLAMDVLTLGMWEIGGMILEMHAAGHPTKLRVMYDDQQLVKEVYSTD